MSTPWDGVSISEAPKPIIVSTYPRNVQTWSQPLPILTEDEMTPYIHGIQASLRAFKNFSGVFLEAEISLATNTVDFRFAVDDD